MRRLASWIVLPTLVATLLSGCGESEPDAAPEPEPEDTSSAPAETGSPTPTESPSAARSARPRVIDTVAKDLEVPWGIAFLPDRSALVTERDSGRVLQVKGRQVSEVGRVDEAEPGGEAGLLGVAVSPSYADNGRVFFYATTAEDNRVFRTTFRNGRLGALEPILTGIPRNSFHDGGRMIFGPDGMLYVSTGEAGQPDLAQDRGSLGGKILRITEAGKPAPGNPDALLADLDVGPPQRPGARVRRRRQPVGLGVRAGQLRRAQPDPEGPQLRVADGRGAWRAVRADQPAGARGTTDDNSPSGLAFVGGRLWLGALRGERLWRVDVDGAEASREKGFFVGDYGRVRTVVAAPDGNLWVTTSNRDGRGDPASDDDRILLVRP